MRFAIGSMVLLTAGYFIGGGEFGILEFLDNIVWHNPLGDGIHDVVLGVDDDRLTDLYAGLRIDFRYGVLAILFGFITALLLPARLALLPCILVLGIFARMWVPLLIELAAKGKLELALEFIPDFVWGVALLPTCAMGIGIARLLRLRRFPRWQIRDAAFFAILTGLFLAAIVQRSSLLFPTTFCGLAFFLSVWLLRQSDSIVWTSPNKSVNRSGQPRGF